MANVDPSSPFYNGPSAPPATTIPTPYGNLPVVPQAKGATGAPYIDVNNPATAGILAAANPSGSTNFGGAIPSADPGGGSSAPAAPAKTPYNIANDPWLSIALGQYSQGNSNLQADYNLRLSALNAPYGSGGDGGVAAANLAYKTAQAQAEAQSQANAHQLPMQLLQIVNQLAAHGVGNSGDMNYLPGEAVYNYNTGLQGLMNDLASKKAGIKIAQQNAASQQAAQSAQHAFAVQQATAEATQWLTEQKQNLHDTLGDTLVSRLFGNNPVPISQDPSITLTSIANSGIPPDILKILQGAGIS